jgi:pimeloyl-ACP methyl ester carboxylesterase
MSTNQPIASTIYLASPDPPVNPENITYLIYFITGNPGLIEYYRSFLTNLYVHLYPNHDIQVFGRSLSGFEVDSPDSNTGAIEHIGSIEYSGSLPSIPKESSAPPPYSLEEQITHSQAALEGLVRSVRKRQTNEIRIIVIGHSVGSYILLELIHRIRLQTCTSRGPSTAIRIAGGICLFPTVTDIAQSPSGRKSSWLLNHAPFAFTASMLVKTLMVFVPRAVLEFLIRSVMGFPEGAARVTAAFVKSRWGVRQALYVICFGCLWIWEKTDVWCVVDIWPVMRCSLLRAIDGMRKFGVLHSRLSTFIRGRLYDFCLRSTIIGM